MASNETSWNDVSSERSAFAGQSRSLCVRAAVGQCASRGDGQEQGTDFVVQLVRLILLGLAV